MARAASEPLYVSRNHLEGSLCDVPLERVLAACKRHLVTGVIRVHVGGDDGVVELRAGAVDRAQLGEASGAAALTIMRAAHDGWYEVAQRLPDLTGELGAAARLEGEIDSVPLIVLMRHCEDHALTCTITVISGFDRACIEYRAGEIARVELNGFFDDDALPQILRWPDARFRIAAPPLDLDVEGWPVVKRAATAPIRLRDLTPPRRLARGSTDTRFAGASAGAGDLADAIPRVRATSETSGEIRVTPAPTPIPAPSAPEERAVEVVALPRYTSALEPARPRRRTSTSGTMQTRPARKRRAGTSRGLSPELVVDRRDAVWLVLGMLILFAVGLGALLVLA